ncbi:MAG: helix-hairpin-helix domain-containing protein [Actinomycetia bacterium]|nr:helix-hairpin-helix domain-containing protein [Actinomycetes bacterium]
MFGSGRPDGTAARARLQSITPRWVPTETDLAEPVRANRGTSERIPAASAPGDAASWGAIASASGRHALPERQRPVWRLDGGAVRGLVSLALAALVGALVVVIAGWPRGDAAPVAASDRTKGPGQSVLEQPSPSASTSEVVIVDVGGAVRRPGVVELASGTRVVDAIEAAGGVRPTADTGTLNLAQVLLDGEQIVVPRRGVAPSAGDPGSVATPLPGATPPPGVVNLNTATEVELDVLPGIGPVLAAAIVEWRTQNGGFTSIEQLQDVSGIGPATFAELEPLVRV